MRALLRTELRRMLTRHLARGIAAVAILVAVVAGAAVLLASHKDTEAHIRLLEARHLQAIESCVATGFNPPLSAIPADDRMEFCANEVVAGPRFTFHLSQLRDVFEGVDFKGTAGPLVILAFLLGASFVGAEWQSGSIGTLLGWESGRLRVLLAKVAVPAAVVFLGALVAQTLVGAALTPAAILRGTTAGVGGAWLLGLVWTALRVGALAALAALAGASLALIGRNTAAALGVGFVYVLVELFIRGFENPAWQRWLVGSNAGVLVSARAPAPPGFGPAAAGGLLLVYVGALLLAAAWSFTRRDVV